MHRHAHFPASAAASEAESCARLAGSIPAQICFQIRFCCILIENWMSIVKK